MTKSPGRKPTKNPTAFMPLTMRLPVALSLAVRQAAEVEGVSMSEYVRRLLVADTTARGLLGVVE